MLVRQQIRIAGEDKELRQIFDSIRSSSHPTGWVIEDHTNYSISPAFERLHVTHAGIDEYLMLDYEKGKTFSKLCVWGSTDAVEENDRRFNQLIQSFYDRIVAPACEERHVDAYITQSQEYLEDWFGEKASKLLEHAFHYETSSSDKFVYWRKFVVIAILENRTKYSTELGRWLESEYKLNDEEVGRFLNEFQIAHAFFDTCFEMYPELKPKPTSSPD